jgi:6-phosphogluconolactonase
MGMFRLVLLNALALISCMAAPPGGGVERFYVGTYSGRIYLSALDLGSASFGVITQAVTTTDPSFLAMTPNRQFLYSVNEGPGTVSAFSVNSTNGSLKLLNSKSSNGGAPAHIVVDRKGRNVIVANYNGGSVTVFPIQADGKIGNASSHIQHPSGALAHCVTLDASDHFAFICDKGLDQVRSYIFDAEAGKLTTNTALITAVAKGSGPRHMTFDPAFKRTYVICELSSTIVGFDYDPTNGILTAFQTVSTLPTPKPSGNTTAEIAVHPSGRFLYGSNRGYNTIAVFTIDLTTGNLTLVQQQTTGAVPRNFALDPTGAYCIVAGQNSNDIRLYTIDQTTGLLTDTKKKLTASAPVCILPFILSPPEPLLSLSAGKDDRITLNIGNSLNVLTYQLFHSASLSEGGWSLFLTGQIGQTNFSLTNTVQADFFRAGVLTNF